MKTTIYIVMCSVGEYSDREIQTWRAFNTIEEAEREVERAQLEFEKIGRFRSRMWDNHDKYTEAFKKWRAGVIAADIGDPEFLGLYGDEPSWYVETCELIVEIDTPNV